MEQVSFSYCRKSLSNILNRHAAMFLYPSVAFLLLFCVIYLIIEALYNTELHTRQISIIFFVVILSLFILYYMFKMSKMIYRFENRQIALTQYGFIIRDRKDTQYAWEQISCVGIIIFSATASRQRYDTQLCVFFEKPEQADLKKLRDSYLYGAFNLDRFILIDYNPSLANKLTQYCGLSIVDYRSVQLHRIL